MICQFCGNEINKNSEFCPYCGSGINNGYKSPDLQEIYSAEDGYRETDDAVRHSKKKNDVNVYLVVAITILALLVCVLVAVIVINGNNKKSETESTPKPVQTIEITRAPVEENKSVYYVRTTPYDESSQLGSYEDFAEAKKVADAAKNEGYNVYDKEGNLLYTPYRETPQPTQKSQTTGKVLYRVRKSANDAQSQIGAFEILENAKRMADNNKASGYKVYDMQGNLIYIP